jgi:hypothetical protein
VNFSTVAVFAFLWSTVKYSVGVGVALAGFDHAIWGFLFTTMGAATGVVFFTYSETWLEKRLQRWFKPKKTFSKTSRRLVRLKQKGGLPLIAFLTPIILSIPVGCLMATAFINDKKTIILWQMGSILLWGGFFFGLQQLLDFNLLETLTSLKGK